MEVSKSGSGCRPFCEEGVLIHDQVFAGFQPLNGIRDSATGKFQAATDRFLRAPHGLEGRVIGKHPSPKGGRPLRVIELVRVSFNDIATLVSLPQFA